MSSSLTVSIGGTNYQILSFSIKNRINERTQFDMVAIDTANTAVFSKGEKIIVTDANLGTLFTGFISTAEPLDIIPQPYTHWAINCVDYHYVADKRTVTAAYTNQYAGYIALDMLQSTLAAEGVTSQFAIQHSTTQSDFAKGTLSTTSATNNVGDGDLELTSSSSVSASYQKQADWNTGIFSNLQANAGGDLSLIGTTRNWNDGNKSQQTLYGLGNPSDSISNGIYILNCSAAAATISRLDFAGTVTNGTILCDITLSNSTVKPGFTWRGTVWNNTDDYAYAVELSTTKIDVRIGNNGAGGSTSSLGSATFGTPLSTGTYTVKVVINGSSFTAYVNGTQYVSVSDGTYGAAGYIALRNRNPGSSGNNAQQFDNFAIFTATSGTWTGPSTSIAAITVIASTIVSWDTSLSQGGTILVQTSINGGTSYQTASNGGPISGLVKGGSGAGDNVRIKITLTATSGAMPDIRLLAWAVVGGYSSPGTRSTAPLANDTMVRANQSGWSPSFDGQTITKIGTGTDAISGNIATIANTTGNCHEKYGSTTGTDEDGTVNFSLSASTINGALELRFTDANNFYQLVASTTALSIIKMLGGVQTTLATATIALSTGTTYVLRFRVAGSAPAMLWGRVWQKGTLEPTTWAVTAQDAGTSAIPLTLYGSKVASGTLATAAQLASATGGTDAQSAQNTPASATTGYMEISPLGGTQAINASLPATPSGKGWIWDVPTLEGEQLNTGNYQFNVGVADTARSDSNVTLVWRAWKRSSTNVFTSIGSITLTGQTVNRTRTNFVFGPTSLSSMPFSAGDKLYLELYAGNITWVTSFNAQHYVVWISTSGTAGVNNDAMTGTPGYQSTGTGNIASGGYALMANGTGTTSFDHLRVTQYPDPSLSLATVQRVGSTFFTWDATLPTNTTLGMDLSGDGVNWFDMSAQNGGAIPFINAQPPPTLDTFNADSSANYTSFNETGGSAATWTWDTANSRLIASGGTNAILINNMVQWASLPVADIDLLCDMDQSDAGGLVWRYVDSSNFYLLLISDGSGVQTTTTSYVPRVFGGDIPFTNVTPAASSATLYRAHGAQLTQLAAFPISFTRGTYHRFRATMLGGIITITMDGDAPYLAQDTFVRANQSGWGTGSNGSAWAITRASPTLAISGNEGTVTGTTSESHMLYGTGTFTDMEALVRFSVSNTSDLIAIMLRQVDDSNWYRCGVSFNNIQLAKLVGGVYSGISPAVGISNSANAFWWLRFRIQGTTLSARTWADGSAEPTAWQVSVNDTSLASGGWGVQTILAASGDVASFDHFTVTPLVPGAGPRALYMDPSPLGAGLAGLWNNSGAVGSRYYTFWIQPQGDYVGGTPFGDTVSAQFIYSRQRLATTDNTVTPQVLDLTIGVTDPNIGLGTLIPNTSYASTFVSANMDDLTNKSANYAWQINQKTQLQFQTLQTVPSPWVLDSSDSMIQKLRIVYEAPGYSNRQNLTNVISTIAFTDTKIGDSNSRSFALSYPNAAAPIITLNNNPQSVGVKGVDANKNWYWQYGDSTIYQDSNGTVLANTDTLSITGMGLTTTTVQRDNLAAQALMQSLEQSGTGIVEAVTDVTQFGLNVAAAQIYGDQLNARWATLGRTFKFETTRTGLAPGQLIPGFALSRGILNAQLFITAVELQARTYSTGGGNAAIRYVSIVESSETPYAGSWQRKLAARKK